MLRYLCNILLYLSLAIALGSAVFFGTVVAPTLFGGDVLAGRTIPGAINALMVDRLTVILVMCGAVATGSALYAASHYRRWVNWVAFGLAVLMLAGAAYTSARIVPEMNALRIAIGNFDRVPTEKEKLVAEFEEGHHTSSMIVRGVVLCALLVLLLHTITLVSAAHWYKRMGGALGMLQKEIVTAPDEPTIREQLKEGVVDPVKEMIEEKRVEREEKKLEEREREMEEREQAAESEEQDLKEMQKEELKESAGQGEAGGSEEKGSDAGTSSEEKGKRNST